jgi:hypothetical protein
MICEWFPCLYGDLGYFRSLTMTDSLRLPVDWVRNKKPKCTLKLSNLIQEVSFIESQYCTSKCHPKLNFKWLYVMNFKSHLLHNSLLFHWSCLFCWLKQPGVMKIFKERYLKDLWLALWLRKVSQSWKRFWNSFHVHHLLKVWVVWSMQMSVSYCFDFQWEGGYLKRSYTENYLY